jgi:hypothetical protein
MTLLTLARQMPEFADRAPTFFDVGPRRPRHVNRAVGEAAKSPKPQ